MSQIITALVPQQNKRRVNIYLDGQFAFGISKMAALTLKTGMALTANQIEDLKQKDEYEKAYQRALHLLSYRQRTEKELEGRLTQAGFSVDIVQSTLAVLKEQHFINDQEFASFWVENRSDFRPRSKRVLQFELRSKGVEEDVIQEALDEAPDDEEQAQKAAARFIRKIHTQDKNVFYRRLYGHLGRLGFSSSIIQPIIESEWLGYSKNLSLEIPGK